MSISHANQAALYQVGMLEEMGVDTNLPSETRQAARAHYKMIHDTQGLGNWNRDGVLYEPEIRLPSKPLPEGYIRALWVTEWTMQGDKWVLLSEPFVTELPPSGYGPVSTAEGDLRDPRTGWALKTVPTRQKAVDALIGYFCKLISDEAKARKFADANVSYSYRREPGQGNAAVFRSYYFGDGGPFYEHASWYGDSRDGDSGVLPFSSSVAEQEK